MSLTTQQAEQLAIELRDAKYAGMPAASIQALPGFGAPVVTYTPYLLNTQAIYTLFGALYGKGDRFARAAAVLNGFESLPTANQRPTSDFIAQINGTVGAQIGSEAALAWLSGLVDPNGTYTPGNADANPPVDPVTSIAAGKLLTPQEGQVLAALGSTQSFVVGAATQLSDVTAALQEVSKFNTAQALAANVNAGQSAALAPVNTYQNGPVTGTPPTKLSIVQQFAAGAFPGVAFTITGG